MRTAPRVEGYQVTGIPHDLGGGGVVAAEGVGKAGNRLTDALLQPDFVVVDLCPLPGVGELLEEGGSPCDRRPRPPD